MCAFLFTFFLNLSVCCFTNNIVIFDFYSAVLSEAGRPERKKITFDENEIETLIVMYVVISHGSHAYLFYFSSWRWSWELTKKHTLTLQSIHTCVRLSYSWMCVIETNTPAIISLPLSFYRLALYSRSVHSISVQYLFVRFVSLPCLMVFVFLLSALLCAAKCNLYFLRFLFVVSTSVSASKHAQTHISQ